MLLLLLHFLVYPIWPPSTDLIIREPRERKVSIFMLCIHTETEPLREKLGERREFCLSGKCRNYLKKLNVHKHSPTHRKYFFLSITVRNNCFFFTSVSLFAIYGSKKTSKCGRNVHRQIIKFRHFKRQRQQKAFDTPQYTSDNIVRQFVDYDKILTTFCDTTWLSCLQWRNTNSEK